MRIGRQGFGRDERGVVTIEWVMIAAVVVVAALAISTFIFNGANGLATGVTNRMTAATPPATP